VSEYDNANLYLDWSGLTPSATLKYQIVTGGHPVPTSLPVFLGGYTKFVGAGPGSYATITAALAASAPGDSILVTRGYSISAAETVSVSGVKITFMPSVQITQTAAAGCLIVSANDVIIDSPVYEMTAAGTISAAVSVTGDDCVIEKCRLITNNAGLTVTDAFNLSVVAERNEIRASIKKTAGAVTNSVTDSGTDNLPMIRG
jgi:DNA-binding cell septation regulator SpoVG